MNLKPIISNGAVFDMDYPIVVFGEAIGKVRGELSEEIVECEADGRFILKFKSRKPGGPYEIKVSCEDESVILSDIYIGKVIFVSGQSNAELPIKATHDYNHKFKTNPQIRLFQVNKDVFTTPSQILHDKWTSLTEENAKEWSAIALLTAEYYYDKLGIPIGVIGGYQGASVIESFLSEDALSKFIIDKSRIMRDHFAPDFASFNADSYLYHHMIENIVPFRFSAVVWYQGESNRTEYEGTYYDKMLIALVEEWRRIFENPIVPFVIIQINDYPVPGEASVTAIQQAQERASEQIDNCELVKISDMGECGIIHPANKREVSERVCAALEKLGV